MVAAGERLPFVQRDDQGHSIPNAVFYRGRTEFTPSPGRITNWHTPGGGVRGGSHIYANYFVPPNYDSMISR
jgi:acetyl-CoA carboxylase biotin carboxylase subunit